MNTASTQKNYKVIDKRGQPKAGLYPSPSNFPGRYRPRFYSVGDTSKTVTAYDRTDYMTLGRSLFAGCPDLGGAIMSKASWCVAPGAFTPVYTGTNQSWGDEAEAFLVDRFFPMCSVMGPNFNFQTMLYLTSIALDVDGDTGLYFTKSRNGFPLVGMISSHRIGQRDIEPIVKGGRFDGYTIVDGVIKNDEGRPIGYRILGDTKDDDYDISVQSFQCLMEPEWSDQYRGISRIARSLTDWADHSDIKEFIKRGIKRAATYGITVHTESGNAVDSGANLIGAEETIVGGNTNAPATEIVDAGGVLYFKAGLGEKLEIVNDDRPSANVDRFLERLQRNALFSIGWSIEALDASKVGGASVRLVQDLLRKSISCRQATLERRAKVIVNYALSVAMQQGMISQNNDDFYAWNFSKGGMITVDNGNEAAADREGYKLGSVTLAEMSSKKGKDWYELRNQQQIETEDLLDRATVLSKKYNLSLSAALSLLSQRNPNTPIETVEDTEDLEDTEDVQDNQE